MWFTSHQTLILRGLASIAFGLLLMVWPSISLEVLVLLFGVFALLEGSLVFATGILARPGVPDRWLTLLAGAATIAVGVVTFLWPGLTQVALLILIAVRALVIGAAELATAVYISRHVSGGGEATWLLASLGLLSIAFATILLAYPGTGLLALVWVIGLYAVMAGLMVVAKARLLMLSRNAFTPVHH
jgi:uncharacterized membrane protein HdeD (DUF308 family)